MRKHNLDPPFSAICVRCGYCCKYEGNEMDFTKENRDKWYDEDWYEYHPFVDWVFNDLHNPIIEGINSIKEAKETLRKAEIEFYEDYGIEPNPFPWGGTLQYCPFLKWMGNKWGCLLHEKGAKPKKCHEYNCYWNRLIAGFEWLFSKDDSFSFSVIPEIFFL